MKNCEHGYRGMCCCNCKNQLKLMCHPWNGAYVLDKIKFGRGPVSQQCGWVCIGNIQDRDTVGDVVFMDTQHGMCELWEEKITPETLEK